MMTEILKSLLENNVLTDEVKDALEISLVEAFETQRKEIEESVERNAQDSFEVAKTKFEKTYKQLEQNYQIKCDSLISEKEILTKELESMEETIETLETKPFVNLSVDDMNDAEKKLVEELEAKYEKAFELAKEKFNKTFDIINEEQSNIVLELNEVIEEQKIETTKLTEENDHLLDLNRSLETSNEELTEELQSIVDETTDKLNEEFSIREEKIKEDLVISTEIFLEQELSEIKQDSKELLREKQGRELLESIKDVVKAHWDIDDEVANDLLEMKKENELKLEQYKTMLKKEHTKLSESQKEIEQLKKKVIVESKGSILTGEKKDELEKLTEHIASDDLVNEIDALMESVVDTFNKGFKKEVETLEQIKPLNESKKTTVISSGNIKSSNEELSNLMSLAGIR